ncbi:MAG: serine/threonine-protein kinase [Gemmataceae bacterium]
MMQLEDIRTDKAPSRNAKRLAMSAVMNLKDDPELEDEIPINLSFLDPALVEGDLGSINHYRVLKVLGAGGMGLVLEGEDTHLKRRVALKIMRRNFVDNYSSRERFLLEARAAASLDSDHIVTIYQVGMCKDTPFLAMQLLQGEPLDVRLGHEPRIQIVEAMVIAKQVAEGLVSAHRKGLVHRDIKPANIWLESDEKTRAFRRVKLLDFGLAQLLETNRRITNVGMVLGTPQYMSPEQATGSSVDGRSDLFSLGTTLYLMLTGHLPFDAPTAPSLLLEITTKNPPRPITLNKNIPAELDNLVMRLLEKSPDDRIQSAIDVVDAIDLILVEYSFVVVSRPSTIADFQLKKVTLIDSENMVMDGTKENFGKSPANGGTYKQENTNPLRLGGEPTQEIKNLAVLTPIPLEVAKPSSEVNPFSEFELNLAPLHPITTMTVRVQSWWKSQTLIRRAYWFGLAVLVLLIVLSIAKFALRG